MSEVWCRCPAHAPSAERILLDLIAELRDAGHHRPAFDDRERLCMVDKAADRAEVRLREVGGDADV